MKPILLPILLIVSSTCILIHGASLDDKSSKTQELEKSITGEHEKLIKEFQSKNGQLLTNTYLKSETFTFGILTANKWNLVAATKHLKRIIKWRKVNKVEKLGEAEVDSKMLKYLPYRLTAVTKDGCPVLELDAGNWMVADYFESREFVRDAAEGFNKHSMQMLEKTRMDIGVNCGQAIVLIGLKNFTGRNYGEPNALSAMITMSSVIEVYYPSIFKKVVIFDSNKSFGTLMDILLPFIGQLSQQITVITDEEKDQTRKLIYKYIAPEQLPPDYYGTKGL